MDVEDVANEEDPTAPSSKPTAANVDDRIWSNFFASLLYNLLSFLISGKDLAENHGDAGGRKRRKA